MDASGTVERRKGRRLALLFGLLGGLGVGLTIGATGVFWFVSKVSARTIDKIALSVQYPGAQTTPPQEQVTQDMEAAFADLLGEEDKLAPVPDWMEGEE